MAEDVTEKNLRELAFDTQRYSGAAIANLVNLAAMRAERDGREQIQYKDLTDVSNEACCMAASSCKSCFEPWLRLTERHCHCPCTASPHCVCTYAVLL